MSRNRARRAAAAEHNGDSPAPESNIRSLAVRAGSLASHLADRIKQLRSAKDLSQQQLADQLGVSKVTIWKWERGAAYPSDRNLGRLAQTLGVSPEALVIENSDPSGDGKSLPEVISEAKAAVAQAAGLTPEKISISMTY